MIYKKKNNTKSAIIKAWFAKHLSWGGRWTAGAVVPGSARRLSGWGSHFGIGGCLESYQAGGGGMQSRRWISPSLRRDMLTSCSLFVCSSSLKLGSSVTKNLIPRELWHTPLPILHLILCTKYLSTKYRKDQKQEQEQEHVSQSHLNKNLYFLT